MRKKILIIDDDVTALDIVSFFFEEQGFDVTRCPNGGSALALVESIQPDVLLVDLLMPGLNGIETVQRVREMGLTEIPVIAFTAVDDVEMHEEALAVGCSEVLTKPCPPERLHRAIQRHLAPTIN